MDCERIIFSKHAIERMFERGISPEIVMDIVILGETIAQYPLDKPFHVVAASNAIDWEC